MRLLRTHVNAPDCTLFACQRRNSGSADRGSVILRVFRGVLELHGQNIVAQFACDHAPKLRVGCAMLLPERRTRFQGLHDGLEIGSGAGPQDISRFVGH
ncbi:hypothetical protein J2X92_000430 [Variovorax paradoxus]|nr:hypothetical protein [Variovorax paradoxus]